VRLSCSANGRSAGRWHTERVTDDRRTRRRPGLLARGAHLAPLLAGVGVLALGQAFGDMSTGKTIMLAVVAALGTAALLFPGSFIGWDAPRHWFAGPRPEPSRAYLIGNRIGGGVLLVGAILVVLLV
jgi:uncharacterized membrane protein